VTRRASHLVGTFKPPPSPRWVAHIRLLGKVV
jgi:hypothetical protein